MMREYFTLKLVTIDVIVLIGCVFFLVRGWRITDKREVILWLIAAGILIAAHVIILNGWCWRCVV